MSAFDHSHVLQVTEHWNKNVCNILPLQTVHYSLFGNISYLGQVELRKNQSNKCYRVVSALQSHITPTATWNTPQTAIGWCTKAKKNNAVDADMNYPWKWACKAHRDRNHQSGHIPFQQRHFCARNMLKRSTYWTKVTLFQQLYFQSGMTVLDTKHRRGNGEGSWSFKFYWHP